MAYLYALQEIMTLSLEGSLYVGASALNTSSIGIQTTAHNIANVSTDGFKPISPTFSDGSAGLGVQVTGIKRDDMHIGESLTPGNDAFARYAAENLPSATELAREIPSLIKYQRNFQANVQTIKTADAMLEYLVENIG